MNIFLGHITACIFWRTATQDQCDVLRPTHALPSNKSVCTAAAAHTAVEGTAFENMPLHVEVSAQSGRKSTNDVVVHSLALPRIEAYYKAGRNVFIASPALTFAQMALHFSFYELVLFGTELCGSFVRDEFSPTGLTERKPLTSPKEIASTLESLGRFPGKAKARKALKYITPNTASPKECEVATRFALFNQYGGFGLPSFKCNYLIDIPKKYQHLTNRSFLKADFCWPDKKVIVEYDSDLHTGTEKIAADTMRRNILLSLGFTVIGITRIQANNEHELERVAEEIARALHVHRTVRCKNYGPKKQDLARVARVWTRTNPSDYFKNRPF